MSKLESTQISLKELLAEDGIGECLIQLKALLPANSAKHNEVLAMTTRLNKLNRDVLKNEITQDVYDVEYAQMINLVILFIDELTETDFEAETAETKSKQGSILYQIPATMTLNEESECRIRLAFEESVIIENIRITADTELKSIRVSEIMEVDIIDPASKPNFEIRPMVSKRMFLDKDDFAEWIFFVKPLNSGEHELWLKVSVLEERMGEIVQRDLVMKEEVKILALAPANPPAIVEKVAAYSLQSGGLNQLDVEEDTPRRHRPKIVIGDKSTTEEGTPKKIRIKSNPVLFENVIDPSNFEEGPSPATPSSRPNFIRIISYGMTGLILVLVGSMFVFNFYMDPKTHRDKPVPGPEIDFAKEQLLFQEAIQDTTGQLLAYYMVQYPSGTFVDSAFVVLNSIDADTPLLDSTFLARLQIHLLAKDTARIRNLVDKQLLLLDSIPPKME